MRERQEHGRELPDRAETGPSLSSAGEGRIISRQSVRMAIPLNLFFALWTRSQRAIGEAVHSRGSTGGLSGEAGGHRRAIFRRRQPIAYRRGNRPVMVLPEAHAELIGTRVIFRGDD
jgi:hypothetical protein